MKAIRIHQYGDASTLKLEEISRLSIADNQILVRIRDAGVNPIDWKIRQGYLKQVMPATFPMTIGQDFAGQVVEPGKNVTEFAAGDRVFGFAQGTYAEYAAAPAITVAAFPNSMDFATAAALPTAGSTALQTIRDVVAAKPGMSILIQGAAGSVGHGGDFSSRTWGILESSTRSTPEMEFWFRPGPENNEYCTAIRISGVLPTFSTLEALLTNSMGHPSNTGRRSHLLMGIRNPCGPAAAIQT